MKKSLDSLLLISLSCFVFVACDALLPVDASPTAPATMPGRTETREPARTMPGPTETPEPARPTPTTLPPNTYGVVDNSTLTGKVIVGYQGWFGCKGDGSPFDHWIHWFEFDDITTVEKLTIDYWPDVSEPSEEELCATGITDVQGNPMYLYSNYHPLTTQRHFLWMAEHGIDGAEVQRFLAPQPQYAMESTKNQVLENAVTGAEMYGRVFFIQYAGSPLESGTLERIKEDWIGLVDEKRITASPSYLHHNGLPVVAIWGLGFKGQNVEPEETLDLIDFFHNNPSPRYRAVVQGGVPSYWRTREIDSKEDPAWTEVYHSLDILNPWHVNSISDMASADVFLDQVIIPDMQESSALGIAYMPVVFPGFSTYNLKNTAYNGIPRLGGRFMWKLAYNLIDRGVEMIEIAMFDEVDEGTAIFKVVEHPDQLPPGDVLIPLDVDGYALPSDWYLTLTGRITEMLRGERPLTPEIEDLPKRDIGDAVQLNLEFITGANWNTIKILNPDLIRSMEPTALEGEVTLFNSYNYTINLHQELEDSLAGKRISARMVFFLDPASGEDSLDLLLTKGSSGPATLRFYTVKNGLETTILSIDHFVTNDGSGTNPLEISIPLE